jgi:non-ribosomal peptide synthetase component F
MAPGDSPAQIGRPIAGVAVELDIAAGRAAGAPAGAGEIVISGAQVARGYAGGAGGAGGFAGGAGGARRYRTGDLARPDGEAGGLVLLGRIDAQAPRRLRPRPTPVACASPPLCSHRLRPQPRRPRAGR